MGTGGAVDRVEPTTLAGEHLVDVDGQVVDLYNERNKFVARGLYNSKSRIRVRLFTWHENEVLDAAFFRQRLQAAIAMRQQLGYELTPVQIAKGESRSQTATRLVFSEADGLSGLVIDRYGDYLVVQPTSLAMHLRAESLVATLQQEYNPRRSSFAGKKQQRS